MLCGMPSSEVNEVFDRAERQICNLNPHSPACPTVTVTGINVHVILAVLGAATPSFAHEPVQHLPF